LLFLTDLPAGNDWRQTLWNNGPLWSLSYEMFYYLIYPAYWKACKWVGHKKTTIASLIISVGAMALSNAYSSHALNLLALYALWCLGAALAHLHANRGNTHINELK